MSAVQEGKRLGRQITKAVIPAAGLGTRFLPATKASPKEMLPLVDKPLIQYVVEEAVGAGIREIIIITGRGKRAIEDHFDISFELEETLRQNGKLELMESLRKISDMADFCYIRQRQALGLGHAILSAKNLIGDEPFAVLLGDDIIDHPTSALQQMIDLYQKNQAPLIGIQKVPKSEVRQYGVIDAEAAVDGLYKINDLVEKPSPKEAPSNLAVIGRYILTPEIFELLEKTKPGKNNEIQLTDALKELARLRNMYGYVIQGKRFDAGDKLGFLKATVEMGLKNPELGKEFRKFLKDLPL
ncbi:UTP--glucose-1-phosphate uridylyltransferase GalU [Candidatus Manganitrophus noduliformans]|uniref:UTP--glucose-1-phosphate uridylyltransferase n=1 Tax=Candidatus Manganitrophus noduliformans TaxID=2606439 RepID=A0A7X6DM13_9BACT|nr:UTP--glucose-1-phosphate uridylyltransferase GalU [Candidatus Manganitrophus noduliformans]